MYYSNLLHDNDVISFDDSNCSYVFNFLINTKKNYYIPMPLKKVTKKIILKNPNLTMFRR